jgi:putative transposase
LTFPPKIATPWLRVFRYNKITRRTHESKTVTKEQIIAVLREAEAGAVNLCRKYGMSDATYYNWKAKYAGLNVRELKRLKALGDENCHLM